MHYSRKVYLPLSSLLPLLTPFMPPKSWIVTRRYSAHPPAASFIAKETIKDTTLTNVYMRELKVVFPKSPKKKTSRLAPHDPVWKGFLPNPNTLQVMPTRISVTGLTARFLHLRKVGR